MLPAVLGFSAHSLTLATRMELGHSQLQERKGGRLGLRLGVDGRVAEEQPAGHCRSHGDRGAHTKCNQQQTKTRAWALKVLLKSQATWDFLKVLVPRMKRFL